MGGWCHRCKRNWSVDQREHGTVIQSSRGEGLPEEHESIVPKGRHKTTKPQHTAECLPVSSCSNAGWFCQPLALLKSVDLVRSTNGCGQRVPWSSPIEHGGLGPIAKTLDSLKRVSGLCVRVYAAVIKPTDILEVGDQAVALYRTPLGRLRTSGLCEGRGGFSMVGSGYESSP